MVVGFEKIEEIDDFGARVRKVPARPAYGGPVAAGPNSLLACR